MIYGNRQEMQGQKTYIMEIVTLYRIGSVNNKRVLQLKLQMTLVYTLILLIPSLLNLHRQINATNNVYSYII